MRCNASVDTTTEPGSQCRNFCYEMVRITRLYCVPSIFSPWNLDTQARFNLGEPS